MKRVATYTFFGVVLVLVFFAYFDIKSTVKGLENRHYLHNHDERYLVDSAVENQLKWLRKEFKNDLLFNTGNGAISIDEVLREMLEYFEINLKYTPSETTKPRVEVFPNDGTDYSGTKGLRGK